MPLSLSQKKLAEGIIKEELHPEELVEGLKDDDLLFIKLSQHNVFI